MIVGSGQIDVTQKLGGFYLLLAALTWAFMSVLIKKVPTQYSQIVITTYSSVVAVILLTPVVLPRLNHLDLSSVLQPEISGGLLYLGMISTAGGFFLWNKGLQLMNASSGGLFFFFQPIVGTFLGWLLLGETIGASFWIGTILIFSGVFIVIKDE
ncbi:Permease of the drug/metabolite transporter (DMT) superfamily [Bacillus badius]|uniref:Permease of the drug/metabolite transporter (DMT) superfamily n=1 Tax=Bacillus badius TaxID=1455 RepID=A0ABR5APF0_BACBA|nr:Permease of the drug/metabolite transporter (DMT) superfamily [Bacillus badius]TDV99722.1 EamA-like transporter family protein [Bacillus badius]